MSQSTLVPAVGIAIPDIVLTNSSGNRSKLSSVRNGSRAVVFFMRAADCPLCLAHVKTITRMMDAGEIERTRFVVIAPGDATQAKKAERRIASSSVSVWASGEHHADVGLGKFLMLQHSGTFVLNADGTVQYAKTSALPTNSFSRGELRQLFAR
jgi:peroxiredoxin